MKIKVGQRFHYNGDLCNSPNGRKCGGAVTVKSVEGKWVKLEEKMAFKKYDNKYFGETIKYPFMRMGPKE